MSPIVAAWATCSILGKDYAKKRDVQVLSDALAEHVAQPRHKGRGGA